MITFDNSRVEYGDYLTPTKADGFIILYETPSKGKITSHLMTATKTVETVTEGESDEQPIERVTYHMKDPIPSATKSFDNDYFTGNVLQQLHDIYLSELREYNPNIVFASTV